MTNPRVCFFIPIDAYVEGRGYIPSLVREGEPGHMPLAGNGPLAQPWYWGHTYETAQALARKENEALGLTEVDVLMILASSMRAGPVTTTFCDVCETRPVTHGGILCSECRQIEEALNAVEAEQRREEAP